MRKKKTLIVVDMQNDFITGSLGTPEAEAIVPNVIEKIKQYDASGDRIIFTKDTHQSNYLNTNEGRHLPVEHCIEGTDGWKLAPEIVNAIGYDNYYGIVNKGTFGTLDWDAIIPESESKDIEIVGLCTDICVVSNALILKAIFPESNITVDASCCAGVTPETHAAALTTMKMCQINVIGE